MKLRTLAQYSAPLTVSDLCNLAAVGDEMEEEPKEHPVPEQFVSSFKDGTLVTRAADHSAA